MRKILIVVALWLFVSGCVPPLMLLGGIAGNQAVDYAVDKIKDKDDK